MSTHTHDSGDTRDIGNTRTGTDWSAFPADSLGKLWLRMIGSWLLLFVLPVGIAVLAVLMAQPGDSPLPVPTLAVTMLVFSLVFEVMLAGIVHQEGNPHVLPFFLQLVGVLPLSDSQAVELARLKDEDTIVLHGRSDRVLPLLHDIERQGRTIRRGDLATFKRRRTAMLMSVARHNRAVDRLRTKSRAELARRTLGEK